MKYFKTITILILAAILAAACNKTPLPEPEPESEAPVEELAPNIMEQFAAYAGTSIEAPLKGTVWFHDTGEEYKRYIWFSEGQAKLFYGYFDKLPDVFGGNWELQRWSDFYESDYTINEGIISTNIQYPLWGETKLTQEITMMLRETEFTITAGDDTYVYDSKDPTTIESMWMYIYADPAPWEQNHNGQNTPF